MSAKQKLWTREELILAFNLYLKIDFGKIGKTNPQIIELANIIGRTPSSIGMRLGNFASVDPYHQQRGVVGLANGKKQVQPIWDEFFNNQEDLIYESERILALRQNVSLDDKYQDILHDIKDLKGETKIRAVKTRVNQCVFRQMVLTNYTSKCAITGIDIPDLLFASHIVPWSKNEKERLNPENGICLSALYDRAFDRGYIGFTNDYKVLLSSSIKEKSTTEYYDKYFAPIENTTLINPIKYSPSKLFLEYHRDTIFDQR